MSSPSLELVSRVSSGMTNHSDPTAEDDLGEQSDGRGGAQQGRAQR